MINNYDADFNIGKKMISLSAKNFLGNRKNFTLTLPNQFITFNGNLNVQKGTISIPLAPSKKAGVFYIGIAF